MQAFPNSELCPAAKTQQHLREQKELYFSCSAEVIVGKVKAVKELKIFRRNPGLGEELLQWTWGCAL